MDFSRVSDGVRLHHLSHRHDGYDDGEPGSVSSGREFHFVSDADPDGLLAHGMGRSAGAVSLARAHFSTHDSGSIQSDHSTKGAPGGPVGSPDAAVVESGANTAGSGGDGYFYGGIIHASLLIYQPVNIAVSVGYGSVALATQTNDVNIDQSAVQIAGIGGNGGGGNIAAGGNVTASSGTGVIDAGDNSAGNGGDGYFSGALVHAPIVIYHPINIAIAGTGGTAIANQSNTVEIDQSATQIAGVGGNGGHGNVAAGGSVITLDPGWGSSNGADVVLTGGNQAGNGGDGSFTGDLVHTSVLVYDPVNIAVAGYNSTSYAIQINDLYVDQSVHQIAGIGGYGGNGNVAAGGSASLVAHGLGGSDAIATGSNSAGNGGNGYYAGSMVDVSVVIYAPVNIAIAAPYGTAEADQVNNVHIDQSAVQIAGIGGNGGHGNLALGGDLATHLLSDLHLIG